MIISIIQPCFVPWLGYFEQMAISDIFVYLDDVQYTKRDWRNTNQLKSPNGMKNICVPVHNASKGILINQARISYCDKWEEVLLNKISEWYRKAPFFKDVFALIEPIICSKHEKLVKLNYSLNEAICGYLDIFTPTFLSSDVPQNAQNKNERIIEICKYFKNVDLLYDGKAAQGFLDLQLFEQNKIKVVFQDYVQAPYRQLWGAFLPYTSILDVMMNCGKDARRVLLSNPVTDNLKLYRSR